jgi:heme-degrading monooxygenase HmoA
MFVAFVTFESDSLEEERVRKVAAEARAMFEGMPGLRTKVFTLGEKGNRATNVYLWDTEDAARGFFSDELVERVTGLYGVRPQVEFADVLELVDNS